MSWSSGGAGALEGLELWRSWSSGEAGTLEKLWRSSCAGGAGTLEKLELWGSWRHIRCSGTLGAAHQTKAHEHMLIKRPKTCYQAPGIRHGWNSGEAGALAELGLWRSWNSEGAGALEELELWRSWSS